MYSEDKAWDMKMRDKALATIESYLQKYKETKNPFWKERAKWWGEESLRYKTRIETFDYSELDRNYKAVQKLLSTHTNFTVE